MNILVKNTVYLTLLFSSSAAMPAVTPISYETLQTTVKATNPFTGATVSDDDKGTVGTIFSEISLGPPVSSEKPTQAKSVAIEGGIVRNYLQTGVTPFNAFGLSIWVGRFRKDDPNATFNFNITSAFLEIGNETPNPASASFRFRILNDAGDALFDHYAKISGQGGTSAAETYQIDENTGPLIGHYREYNPFEDPIHPIDRIAVAELSFDPFSDSIDLSDVEVGDNFAIVYLLETFANGPGIESWVTSRFSDPADFENGGITTTFSGLTPMAVPIVPAGWLFMSGFAVLFRFARQRI